MTDDEIISVVWEHRNGKKIQARVLPASRHYSPLIDHEWSDVTKPDWNFHDQEFRVAPEPRKPREVVLVYKGNGTWKEIESCGVGLSEHPVRFMEVI